MPNNTEPKDPRLIRGSASFPPDVIAEIQRAAREGIYEIRGFGAKRHVPSFDDLVFLGASMSRYPEWQAYKRRTKLLIPGIF